MIRRPPIVSSDVVVELVLGYILGVSKVGRIVNAPAMALYVYVGIGVVGRLSGIIVCVVRKIGSTACPVGCAAPSDGSTTPIVGSAMTGFTTSFVCFGGSTTPLVGFPGDFSVSDSAPGGFTRTAAAPLCAPLGLEPREKPAN